MTAKRGATFVVLGCANNPPAKEPPTEGAPEPGAPPEATQNTISKNTDKKGEVKTSNGMGTDLDTAAERCSGAGACAKNFF